MAVPGGIPRWTPDGPSSARVWSYLLGGRNYGHADETAGAELEAACPAARRMLTDSRLFAARAAAYAAGDKTLPGGAREPGIGQFIDLGCGFPPKEQTHHVARSVRPGARVAYVDLDDLVCKEIDALLGEEERAGVAVVRADLRDPDAVLAGPGVAAVIDLAEPVCVLAVMSLHWSPPREARRVVAGWSRRLAAGSLVAVAVPRVADPAVMAAVLRAFAPSVPYDYTPEAVTGLLAGLELVPPGIAPAAGLRPGWRDAVQAPPDGAYVVAGIGRKP